MGFLKAIDFFTMFSYNIKVIKGELNLKKPKIAIVLNSPLPVPSVLGGAVEELITILANQNEIEKRAKLYIFSCENEKAKEVAKAWRYSKLIQCPKFYKPFDIKNRVYYRLTKKEIYPDNHYFPYLNKKLIKGRFDAVVFQGDFSRDIIPVREKIARQKLSFHLHYHHKVLRKPLDTYGKLIGVSNFVVDEFKRTNPFKDFKTYTVYNAINTKRFGKTFSQEEKQALKEKLNIAKDDFVVLFCGRILEIKGVLELLKAIASIENPKIKLVIAGSTFSALDIKGDYESQVEKLCEQNKEKIIKTGYIDNNYLPIYYQIADVLVAPSLCEEALSLVILEGLISGLPIIMTNSGGNLEMVNDKCAIILDKSDKELLVDNLKNSILALFNDKDKREEMSKEGKRLSKNYSESKFYNDFINAVLD